MHSQTLQRHLPLLAAILTLWAVLIPFLIISVQRNDGHLIYALDDAYIHMSMAKNVVLHRVWGVTPHEFASASSSYLWTLVLSLSYLLFGVNNITPFLLNLLLAAAVLAACWQALERFHLPNWYVFLTLLLLILATPFIALCFGGMEHTMHVLLTVVFTDLVVRELSTQTSAPFSREMSAICALAPLLTLARFEGIAIVAIAIILFLQRRLWTAAIAVAAPTLTALVIPAALSKLHGGFLVPNSVLLKVDVPPLPTDLQTLYMMLLRVPVMIARYPYHGGFLLIAAILLLWRRKHLRADFRDPRQLLLTVFIAAAILHLQYGRCGWFYRYDAYIVALAVFAIMASGYEFFTLPFTVSGFGSTSLRGRIRGPFVAVAGLLVLSTIPFSYTVGTPPNVVPVEVTNLYGRVFSSLNDLAWQTTNIYQQQVQMGRFVGRYYDTACVIANDIGAITYFTNARLIDLVGLGSTDVVNLARGRRLGPDTLDGLAAAKGAQVAILYDEPFGALLPGSWIRVGQWKIHNNKACAGDTVTFYAMTGDAAARLRQSLVEFSAELPQSPTPVDWRLLWSP